MRALFLALPCAAAMTCVSMCGGWMPLVVGLVVATAAAALAVHWLVAWLGTHGLGIFGWWRIVLSVLLLAGILSGRLNINPPPQLDEVKPELLFEPNSKKRAMTPVAVTRPASRESA